MRRLTAIIITMIFMLSLNITFATEENGKELLINRGFEEGLEPFIPYAKGIATVDSTQSKTGKKSCLVSGRENQWDSPAYNIKGLLLDNGQGLYTLSAYIKNKSGNSKMMILINYKDDTGVKWITSQAVDINDKEFTLVSSKKSINWVGDLKMAILYVQNEDKNLSDIYVDDVSFRSHIGEKGAELPKPDIALRNDKTLVGAIRWDAWTGDLDTANTAGPDKDGLQVGQQVERSLSPSKYHYRVPWFGEIVSENKIKANGTRQEVIDREIRYAKAAGIDYWAFVYYRTSLSKSREMYLDSMYRNGLKWCHIIQGSLVNQDEVDKIIEDFKNEQYVKTKDDRAVVYFFPGIQVKLAKQLTDGCEKSGLKKPYIIIMGEQHTPDDMLLTSADALSAYCHGGNSGVPYESIIKGELAFYNKAKSFGAQLVPIVCTGWDKRPRFDNPVSWELESASKFADSWVTQATTWEIVKNLKQALEWSAANKENTVFNSVIVYAWNENDEGGWINPTLFELRDSKRPVRLDAIRDLLIEDRVEYKDISDFSWASPSIGGLQISGVFENAQGENFEPSKQVTRGEFLSWLVRTLGLHSESKDNFSDIDENIFYSDEIAIAKKLDLTTGIGNNQFAPDELITRQDMMVLSYRVLSKLNMLPLADNSGTLNEFNDKSQIANYAYDGVSAMVNAGFIKGNEGNINPRGNLTRAETAVTLYRILDK